MMQQNRTIHILYFHMFHDMHKAKNTSTLVYYFNTITYPEETQAYTSGT